MRKMGLFLGLIAVLVLAEPARAQDAPPQLQIEISDRNPIVMRPFDITVRVYDPDDPSRLMDPPDPDSLIEFREVSGSDYPAVRPAMIRESEGVYTTTISLVREGTWSLVALPELADRGLLRPASIDQLTVQVGTDVARSDADVDPAGTVAVVALIAGGLIIAALAGPSLRRPKGQPPAAPVQHDSWWTGA